MTISRLQLYVDPRDIPLKIKCATKKELENFDESNRYSDWYKACAQKELDIRKEKKRLWRLEGNK